MVYEYCKVVFVEDFYQVPKPVMSRYLDRIVGDVLNKNFSTDMIKEMEV